MRLCYFEIMERDDMLHPLVFVLLCAAMFLTGTVDAIAGGGGLISLPVLLMTGLPVRTAYGTNKLIACMGCAAASWQYWKKGYTDLAGSVAIAVPMVLTELLGTFLVYRMPEQLFRGLLTVMLPVAALFTIFAKGAFQHTRMKAEKGRSRDRRILIGIGLFMGLYNSLIAAAGATIGMILLSALLHYDVRAANGTLKLGLTAGCCVSSLIYISTGNVSWQLAVPAIILDMLGCCVGVALATKKGAGMVRPVALIVVAAYSLKSVLELLS